MISRLEGTLVAIGIDRIEVRAGAVTHELLVPAALLQRLSGRRGETIELHTLHYLESHGQGTSFIPRLIGFETAEERAFFELFTTVKGLGNRKALRALQLPFSSVAEAIAARDVHALVALPEIGKRTAEAIVVELHDKVSRFIELKPAGAPVADETRAARRDAVAVLVQLGETRVSAERLVDRAAAVLTDGPEPDELVTAALRLRDTG